MSPEAQRIVDELRASKNWPKADPKQLAKIQSQARIKDIRRIKTRVSPLKGGGLAGPIGGGAMNWETK